MTENTYTIHLNSLEELAHFGREFASVLESGILVCLYGEIGVGKTTFVQYVSKELGITENITSPSFVLLNEYYTGRFPVYHFDLYRLEEEGIDSIISELVCYLEDNRAVSFLEWPEYSRGILPKDRLEVSIFYDENYSSQRKIELRALSNKAESFIRRLEKKCVNSKF